MRNLKKPHLIATLGLALAVMSAAPVAAQQLYQQQVTTVVVAQTTTTRVIPARRVAAPVGDAKIYRYEARQNYCPAGLQPITIAGSISCGVPNQRQTYQQAMRHPQPRVHHQRARSYSARPACREGTKGCR